MKQTRLKTVSVYLSEGEYREVKALADDEGVSVSQVIRAKLGLPYSKRGAPEGNRNRSPKKDRRRASVKPSGWPGVPNRRRRPIAGS